MKLMPRSRRGGLALSGAAVASAEASQRIAQAACFFVLAAALSPSDFGLAAVAFLTLQIVNSLTYAGLGQAVQTLGPNRQRDRTALGMALVFGGLGAVVMVVSAPLLCRVLNAPDATPLVQLIALSLPVSQFAEVKTALIERDGRFGRTATAQIVASASSATGGVTLALVGAGPVALIAQTLIHQAIRLLILQLSRPDRIGVELDRRSAREIWQMGVHLLGTAVMFSAYGNADNAVVGAVSGPKALGGYGFVYNLANLPFYLIGMAANRVMLPTYARRLREGQPVARYFERAAVVVGLATALPLGFLLMAGPSALGILFDHKWDYVGTTLQVLVVFAFARTVAATTVPVLVSHHQARRQRTAQQWLLGLMLVAVVPATLAFGTVGTASAVTVPQVVVGMWLLRESTRLTAARLPVVGLAITGAAVVGVLGGAAGLATLDALPSMGGVAAAVAATTIVWAATGAAMFAAVRPRGAEPVQATHTVPPAERLSDVEGALLSAGVDRGVGAQS